MGVLPLDMNIPSLNNGSPNNKDRASALLQCLFDSFIPPPGLISINVLSILIDLTTFVQTLLVSCKINEIKLERLQITLLLNFA